LPRLEQQVFKFKFEHGLEFHSCLASLQSEFPGLTEPQLQGVLSHINNLLTPRQHWLLSTRQSKPISLDNVSQTITVEQIADPGEDPETLAEISEEHEQLNAALAKLSSQHRLLLKLRYQQDLSLKEVARLTRLGDPFRARRHIQAALQELSKYLVS
jgi:RNA polymerase sigma factor (sigma-70 family)